MLRERPPVSYQRFHQLLEPRAVISISGFESLGGSQFFSMTCELRSRYADSRSTTSPWIAYALRSIVPSTCRDGVVSSIAVPLKNFGATILPALSQRLRNLIVLACALKRATEHQMAALSERVAGMPPFSAGKLRLCEGSYV